MTRPRVLVTRRWPQAVETKMAEVFDLTLNTSDRPLTEPELKDALGQYDAVLPTVTDRLPAAVFDRASTRTRILANYGVGFAHIDTAAAKERGIAVTNTPDVLSECTADIAMTLLLMVARRAGEGGICYTRGEPRGSAAAVLPAGRNESRRGEHEDGTSFTP